ncbi:uncharacterized protein LOC127262326 [Andrographis paniculata]|uniref:uncharacterized protein LOC127262326 n=1 Tax=Andrographis paniculata TaxID=175694 RepID=UPI0021E7E065|nr:uncharacterized protein LOC127262326 [Andrographis paniculata]
MAAAKNIIDENRASCEVVSADVLELILFRLPVKSLLRLKSVSESWNHTISNRDFAIAHLRRSKNSLFPSRKKFLFWDFSNLLELKNNELKPFWDHKINGYIVWQCCDGLLLLSNYDSSGNMFVALWNQSAKTYTNLGFPFPSPEYIFTCGINFDSLSKDYKILVTDLETYAVFSNKSGRWSELKEVKITIGEDIKSFPLDGHICWISQVEEEHSYTIEILLFDFKHDKFCKFFYDIGRLIFDCRLVHSPPGQFCMILADNFDKARVVWKKAGGEWMEFNDVPVPVMECHSEMHLTEDKELIFTCDCYGPPYIFTIYNLIEKESREISRPDGTFGPCHLFIYVDNLFFSGSTSI